MTSKDWTNRLITGLFTAAAAWGSVTVEIRRTVNARAEITEQRIEQRIADRIDQATRELAAQQAALLDTMRIVRPSSAIPVTANNITVLAPKDTLSAARQADLAARLDAIENRLRFVAIAIAQLNDGVRAGSKPKYSPGYRDRQ